MSTCEKTNLFIDTLENQSLNVKNLFTKEAYL